MSNARSILDPRTQTGLSIDLGDSVKRGDRSNAA